MLYVGIDIGKFSHFVAFWSGKGKPTIFKILVRKERVFKLLKNLKEYSKDEILIGMEATGHYFLSLYEFLFKSRLSEEFANLKSFTGSGLQKY